MIQNIKLIEVHSVDYAYMYLCVKLPVDSFSSDPERSWMQPITSLAISPSEELLTCCTAHSQIYSYSLSATDPALTQGQVRRATVVDCRLFFIPPLIGS